MFNKFALFYFSGAGNTKHMAEEIAESLKNTKEFVTFWYREPHRGSFLDGLKLPQP